MASDNKTIPTGASVDDFLGMLTDPVKIADSYELIKLMSEVTGQPPKMWGPSIIGFGSYHYKYDSGREGDMCAIGFSPRKSDLTIYLLSDLINDPERMANFGKHKTGKVCLYIKKLADINMPVLRSLIEESYSRVLADYPSSN